MKEQRTISEKQLKHLEKARKILEEKNPNWRGCRPNKKNDVLYWRINHPNGTKTECKNDTGITYSTIRKYWDLPLEEFNEEEYFKQKIKQKQNEEKRNIKKIKKETGQIRSKTNFFLPNQKIGPNNIEYIKEDNPYISPQGVQQRKAIFKCPICGKEFSCFIKDILSGAVKGCGNHSSIGEDKIAKIFDKNNIEYVRQKSYDDLKSKNNRFYRYDFYLPKYNTLIEYDGEQHYKEGFGKGPEYLKEVQQNDKIKNQYAIDHNIKLIRIPYTDYDKINYNYIIDKIF